MKSVPIACAITLPCPFSMRPCEGAEFKLFACSQGHFLISPPEKISCEKHVPAMLSCDVWQNFCA